MTRTMYDSVTVEDIPANATMVAGYVDGIYANTGLMRQKFPHATVVEIAVNSHTNAGDVLDVETGDATPSEAVLWVKLRRASGANPSVYCNASVWPSVKSAFRSAGIAEPHYWIAKWDGSTSIPAGAVAKQYKGASSGHHYDTSVVADTWPGVDNGSNPRPVPKSAVYVVKAGDSLSAIAVEYHLTLKQIEALNPQIKNPNLIHPGDKVNVSGVSNPAHKPATATYVVKKGDTLSGIAKAHGLGLAEIEKLNPGIENYNLIYPGEHINL